MSDAPAERLRAYGDAIDDLATSWLSSYLQRLEKIPDASGNGKEFNDSVWGTIPLNGWEVIVLDSPLLQRLRRIRQLGVVHLVYPGANHTRFEHSLGVAYQVSEIAAAINSHAPSAEKIIDEDWERTLRMAALLHDTGHGLMSHVVENALAGDEECEDLQLAFKRQHRLAKTPQLSEIAAHHLVNTTAVRDLLAHAFRIGGVQIPSDLPNRIGNFIAGKPVDGAYPTLHELISGPFDADKLDYMPRDAAMCGVPVVTDVVRLIQKIRAVSVASADIPSEMRAGLQHRAAGHHVIGVARSGASALDEVSLSRSLMFDKIYRHHKVRAVEAMVGSALEVIAPVVPGDRALLPLQLADEQFVGLSVADLTRMNDDADAGLSESDVAAAADLLTRIRDRDIFVRAFAFAQTMPMDAYRNLREQEQAAEKMVRKLGDAADKTDVVAEIATEVRAIAALLDRTGDLEPFNADLTRYIRIDPPATDGHGSESDQSRAFLIDARDHLLKFEKVRAESRGWSDAYVNAKDVGYVFAPREIADMVHIAAGVVVRTRFGVHIPEQMHDYAKQGTDAVDEGRRKLDDAGYYDDKPRDLAPAPDELADMQVRADIATIVSNLQGYSGPAARAETKSANGVNATLVGDWAAQFSHSNIKAAVAVAKAVRFISRNDTNDTLLTFAQQHPDLKKASIVPLGDPKDGSAVYGYYAGDAGKKLGWDVLKLTEALKRPDPIVFVDDMVGRGSSAISIIANELGLPDEDELNEARGEPLDVALQAALRDHDTYFVWTIGRTDGAQRVQKFLENVGITAETFLRHEEDSIPTVDQALASFSNSEQAAFKDEAIAIGKQLIPSDTDPEKAAERYFGYGNKGYLVVTSYNTPTMTLTALWATGEANGRHWTPLLPRRKKE